MLHIIAKKFPSSSYIVSAVYDWIAFILAPLISLTLGMAIAYDIITNQTISLGRFEGELWLYIVLVMTQAHLLITGIRAYGNQKIYALFRKRVLFGPPLLFLGNLLSPIFLTFSIVLNVAWDAYHSSLQTFGFTRLYDVRVGNYSPKIRMLDRFLNLLIYAGPILGVVTLLAQIDLMKEGPLLIETLFFKNIPFYVNLFARDILITILAIAAVFIPYYIYIVWQESKTYPVSFQKVAILILTAMVSILAWGFNTFGVAFLIMNFFHVWQYFAMVYWSERSVIMKRFNLSSRVGIALIFFLLCLFTIITAVLEILTVGVHLIVVFYTTLTTCHFWFDGFIWSVKKQHIK
ncbi:MAG: hypothetical protein VW397_02775 [Candidatus Margulisiibacteriota bacterium]